MLDSPIIFDVRRLKNIEKLKDIDCERTLEYLLWKIPELDTKEEIRELIMSMLKHVHSESMKEIESKLPVVIAEHIVKTSKKAT